MTDYHYSSDESRKQFQRILKNDDRKRESEAEHNLEIGSRYPRTHETRGPDADKLAFLPEAGYHIVSPEASSLDRGGMHAHRGVIDEGEHVDHETLIAMVEDELGYSFDEARLAFDPYAYAEEVPNYYAIRDRMIEIHEAGGNISLLADVLGIKRGTLATAIWRQKQRRKNNDA